MIDINPFSDVNPVEKYEDLIGYDREVRKAYGLLRYRTKAIHVQAPPRCGKTSFLRVISNPETARLFAPELAESLVFINIPMRREFKSSDELFRVMAKALESELEKRAGGPAPAAGSAETGYGDAQGVPAILSRFQERGFKVVLMIDDADKLANPERFNTDFFNTLRSYWDDRLVYEYVLASVRSLQAVNDRVRTSGFIGLFSEQSIHLAGMDPSAAEKHVRKIFNERGGGIDDEVLTWLLSSAGTQPRALKSALEAVWEMHPSRRTVEELTPLVERAVRGDFRPRMDYVAAYLPRALAGSLERNLLRAEQEEMAWFGILRQRLNGKFQFVSDLVRGVALEWLADAARNRFGTGAPGEWAEIGETWERLEPESRVILLTSQHNYETARSSAHGSTDLDYGGVALDVLRAFERELRNGVCASLYRHNVRLDEELHKLTLGAMPKLFRRALDRGVSEGDRRTLRELIRIADSTRETRNNAAHANRLFARSEFERLRDRVIKENWFALAVRAREVIPASRTA